MNPILVAAGVVVVAGGIACVTARRAAVVAIGAALLLAAAPLLAEPLPSLAVLAERAVGAALAGELLWLGLRGRAIAGASSLAWPPMALLALAAFGAGVGAQRLVPDTGPPEALGAALALVVVAIVAVAGRSDGIHLGLAAVVLFAAADVVRLALSGPPSALETLLAAGTGVAAAAAVALLVPRLHADPSPGDGEAPPDAPAGAAPSGVPAPSAGIDPTGGSARPAGPMAPRSTRPVRRERRP